MERNPSGALRAPGAFGASGTSDPHAIHHALLLSHSGAAAFGRGTADDAACGRAGIVTTRRIVSPLSVVIT